MTCSIFLVLIRKIFCTYRIFLDTLFNEMRQILVLMIIVSSSSFSPFREVNLRRFHIDFANVESRISMRLRIRVR